ncbi:MAG: hypothetical protein LC655_07310, partial [Bacteroidales bacterium]|nr:hypothetical protein [Bacteroidales bacterium]
PIWGKIVSTKIVSRPRGIYFAALFFSGDHPSYRGTAHLIGGSLLCRGIATFPRGNATFSQENALLIGGSLLFRWTVAHQ